jgi:hypothetical protein
MVFRVAALVRADLGLYLFIVVYTLAGFAFLSSLDGVDRAAYSVYLYPWMVNFILFTLVVAIGVDVIRIVHRFDARRRLALGRMFSADRVARLIAGICLLTGLMVFQGTFTSIKNALPLMHNGFPYDVAQADLDKLLHMGVDPWRALFAIAESDFVRLLVEWNYNVFWFAICFGALFYVATSPQAASIRNRYICCFMLVWAVLGNVLAGVFLSAGPAFYGAVTGDEARFAAQLEFLWRGVETPHSAARFQFNLWKLFQEGKTGLGSGISAFPSVHVGLVTMNALFLWEYSWRAGLIGFAYVVIVCASSVYLAWHYAIDGYAAIAVTIVIYLAAKKVAAARLWVGRGKRTEDERAAHQSFLSATSSTK